MTTGWEIGLDDYRTAEVLGADPDLWEPLSPSIGGRFSGADVSAAIVFGIAENMADVIE